MIARRVETWGPHLAATAVGLSFVLLLLAGLYTFVQQESVNRKLCAQTIENRAASRQSWDVARQLILSNEDNPLTRDQINEFFDAILENIPPLRCIDNKPVVKEEQ